jgi:hypothetical protein
VPTEEGEADAPLVFRELPIPAREEVEQLTETIARRITRLVEKLSEEETGHHLDETAAALQAALAKAMSAPTSVDQLSFAEQDHQGEANQGRSLCARVAGFSLHAGQSAALDDRDGLERLCRYGLRAPFSQERLSLREDGQVVYELARPWPNSTGATHLVLDPIELLQRLAALIPAPYTHLIRRHGCFASRSKYRWRLPLPPERDLPEGVESAKLIPSGKQGIRAVESGAITTATDSESSPPKTARPKRYGYSWAALLHRVFFVDALLCLHCGGRQKVLSILTDPLVVGRILGHLGQPTTALPTLPSREDRSASLWDGEEWERGDVGMDHAPP